MASDSSFDVVSDFDDQEMRNALDQVRREVQQRYDFKGVTYELTPSKTELVLLTDDEFRQHITLRRGLDEDLARKLSKLIREEFPKSKPQIQGDAIRVFGKSRDDLQRVITRLKELDEPVALQFTNYR